VFLGGLTENIRFTPGEKKGQFRQQAIKYCKTTGNYLLVKAKFIIALYKYYTHTIKPFPAKKVKLVL